MTETGRRNQQGDPESHNRRDGGIFAGRTINPRQTARFLVALLLIRPGILLLRLRGLVRPQGILIVLHHYM